MSNTRNLRVAVTALVCGVLGGASVAHGYSTKLHLITAFHMKQLLGRDCKINLADWNRGQFTARKYIEANVGKNRRHPAFRPGAGGMVVQLSRGMCDLITNPKTYPYFLAAATGPDTFPGMFGNTDATHALLWNAPWQIQVLWKNAQTPPEKAFALGWLVHFAGDLNAHGLANMHAGGVWMSHKSKDAAKTVWGHIATETYYAKLMTPYPKGFDNRLAWPEAFVKKMFFNPTSPIYQHYDYLLNRYLTGPDSDRLGSVAKAFGTMFRTMFLLWDFHGKEMHRWRGHKDHYITRKDRSVSDYFHWLFADQAFNLHKKKLARMKTMIDTWYEGTARAQQAIVADDLGVFDGKKRNRFGQKVEFRYDQVYESFGKKFTKKDAYASSGIGGLLDAYKFLGDAVQEYISPADLVTITDENSPVLKKIVDALNKAGQVGKAILDGIRSALSMLKDVLAFPLRAVGAAISNLLEPVKKQISELFFTKALCGMPGMDSMCKTIDAQRSAFNVKRADEKGGHINTYLNWPIYRNTIVAASLMLKHLDTTKNPLDETSGPVFGLPSGDFGCTARCTPVGQQHWRSFMPMAGHYYDNATVRAALPDYCMEKQEARRAEAINQDFANQTNDQTNFDYTCLAKAKAGTQCKADAYANQAPAKFQGKIGEFMQKLYDAISGRWTFTAHTAGRTGTVIETAGVDPTKPEYLCYQALGLGPQALAGNIPDPDKENAFRYQKIPYSLRGMLGDLFKPLGELFMIGLNAVTTWVKAKWDAAVAAVTAVAHKVCTKVETFIDNVFAGAERFACETACRVKSPERRRVCVPLFGCNNIDVPFTLDRGKFNTCVADQCKRKEKKILEICK